MEPHTPRQRAFELLLLWEGRVSNARMRELFDIHYTLISRDIASYRSRFPDNVRVGTTDFEPTLWAKPQLTTGNFHEYACLVGAIGSENPMSTGVPSDHTFIEHTSISPQVFRELYQAVKHRLGVVIEYASLNLPERHDRLIFPIAFIKAGPRWHMRAYCVRRQAFREFNLGRISNATPSNIEPPSSAALDAGWDTIAEVRLVPHQALSPAQAQLIREEYMAGTSALVLNRRVALVPYLLQGYRAAIDPLKQVPPEYLLQVLDPETLPGEALWSGVRETE